MPGGMRNFEGENSLDPKLKSVSVKVDVAADPFRDVVMQ